MRYLISPTAWGMLTSPTGWGMLAGLVGLLGYLPYLRDAWRRTSQPDPAAWLIWTVEYSVLLAAQAAQHPPWAALCLAGLQLAGTCAVLAVLAVRGEWRWGFGRGVLLGGSVAVMAVWRFTHTPATAMCLVLAVEGAGMVLVILGAYRRPGSETPLTWKAFTLAGLLDLRALSGQTAPLLFAYPAFFVVMGSGVLTAIALGRRRARRAARRLVLHPQNDPESLITICHEAHGARGHWVLAAPRPWLAPSRPGIPAAAGPAPPAAAAHPVLPARTIRPVLPATTVQPVLPATAAQPVLPATTVQPALPATTVQPVLPATAVQPVLPAAAQPVLPATTVQPVLPAAAAAPPVLPPAPQRRAIPAAPPVPAPRRVWPESDPGWPASRRPGPSPIPDRLRLSRLGPRLSRLRPRPDWDGPRLTRDGPRLSPARRVAGPAVPESWRRHPREAPPLDLAERRERAR